MPDIGQHQLMEQPLKRPVDAGTGQQQLPKHHWEWAPMTNQRSSFTNFPWSPRSKKLGPYSATTTPRTGQIATNQNSNEFIDRREGKIHHLQEHNSSSNFSPRPTMSRGRREGGSTDLKNRTHHRSVIGGAADPVNLTGVSDQKAKEDDEEKPRQSASAGIRSHQR